MQDDIRKPSFQEIARQNAQQLALSQAPGVQGPQTETGQTFAASGSFVGAFPGTSGKGPVSTFGTAFTVNSANSANLPRAGVSGLANQRSEQSSAQDLSLLVENVKLMVNQLSLLQHDQQEQLKTNQRLREELADVKRELRAQSDAAARAQAETNRRMEALDKRLTGLRGLFRTLTVQSEFKDNLVAQMQREFDEVRAIFKVQPGGGSKPAQTAADELSDELQDQNAILRQGLDALES